MLTAQWAPHYYQKVLEMFRGSIQAYYPLWDLAGQQCSDISGNRRHAYYNGGITLGQAGIGDGRPSALFNGTTGYVSGMGILAGTNLPINPVFGIDASDWTNAGFATMERSTTVARFGAASLRLYDVAVATADKVSNGFMAVTAGTTYSMSQWVKKTICTGTGRLLIDWYTAADAYISSSTVALTAGTHDWKMYSVSAAAPGTAAKAKVALDGNGLTAATEFEAYVDGVNLTATTIPIWQINGDDPGCAWTGAAHASTSTRTEAFSGAAGTLAAWVKIPAGVWTDGAVRRSVILYADGNNYIRLPYRNGVDNSLSSYYVAGGTTELQSGIEYGGITSWLHMAITWDKAAEEVKYYVNGAQWGATDTALGVWAGALAPANTLIGANSIADLFHSGNIAHVLLLNRAATAREVAAMANPGGSQGLLRYYEDAFAAVSPLWTLRAGTLAAGLQAATAGNWLGNVVTNGESWTGGPPPTGWTAPALTLTAVDSTVDPGAASGGADTTCLKSVKTSTGTNQAAVSSVSGVTLVGAAYIAYARMYSPSANTEVNAARLYLGTGWTPASAVIATTAEDVWQLRNTGAVVASGAGRNVTLFTWGTTIGDTGYYDSVELYRQNTVATLNWGSPNIIATLDLAIPAAGVVPFSAVFRYTDALNYWEVRTTPNTAGTDLEIIEVVAGVATQRATADIDWTAGGTDQMRVNVYGTTIAVEVKKSGAAAFTAACSYTTMASGAAAVDHGLMFFGTGVNRCTRWESH